MIQGKERHEQKIVIYDQPMCCSSGVCGPNPDQTLIEFQNILEKVGKMGVTVERFIITQEPEKFKENAAVIEMLQKHQLKALPITVADGKIVKSGSYPTLDEFKILIKES